MRVWTNSDFIARKYLHNHEESSIRGTRIVALHVVESTHLRGVCMSTLVARCSAWWWTVCASTGATAWTSGTWQALCAVLAGCACVAQVACIAWFAWRSRNGVFARLAGGSLATCITCGHVRTFWHIPGSPGVPGGPTGASVILVVPFCPGVPFEPGVPAAPFAPGVPGGPAGPRLPPSASLPPVPGVPLAPFCPAAPASPAGPVGHSMQSGPPHGL